MPSRKLSSGRRGSGRSSRRKLATYSRRRDFSRTTEPADGNSVRASQERRFVIQKHAARRLHWDLRLELDGVFKSWAVTRGPSLDPADKRLAVEVEDHPLAYGDFEGTIPRGEYGGGTVQLWDRGYWTPADGEGPAKSLKRGELKFSLEGERLRGGWVLVRMRHDRNGGKRTNWLLIKHRDDGAARNGNSTREGTDSPAKATEELMATDRSVASGRTLAQIGRGTGRAPVPFMNPKARARSGRKQAGPGIGVDAVSRDGKAPVIARKAVARRRVSGKRQQIPAFVEPQLCKLVDSPPVSADWLHEIKFDGYRLQLRVVDGRVTLKTRKGLDWTNRFAPLVTAAAALPDCLIDGELCALDAQGRSNFSTLQAALSSGDGSALMFYAFDLLFGPEGDLRQAPLLDRKTRLRTLLTKLKKDAPLRWVDHVVGSGLQTWRQACKLSLEGIVSKRADARYVSGRTAAWVKSKCRAGQEVVIGGYTSAGAQLRSLLVGVRRAGKLHYAGRVGTGYGGDASRTVMPKLKALASDADPFGGAARERGRVAVHWVKPELVAEIEFAGWTGDHKVRQAAFKGLRLDKPASEVRAERVVPVRSAQRRAQAQQRGAGSRLRNRVPGQTRAGRRRDAKNDATAHLTHPDKILWPATKDTEAATKLDLANYFLAVADWMLEHTRGRPCSLVRAPDGINGQQFFQRHAMAGHSPDVHTIRLAGDRKPYLQVDSVDALLAIAQMAGVELHPGNGMPDEPETPGRLVFDLDPGPGVDFGRVVTGALELRERLSALGLVPFCKTTGGKGLHVVLPLAAERGRGKALTWSSAKLFAQALCAQMAEDSPGEYLISMSKARRKDRIFLDYLRNDRLATAVAPLSPRARPGATVSMPLDWSQVRKGLDAARFNLHTVPALLPKLHAWDEYAHSALALSPAARRLLASQHAPSRAA